MDEAWDDVYMLCEARWDQRALERTHGFLEGHLRAGDFTRVNALLEAANVRRLGAAVLVGILTITFHGKSQLPARSGFFDRAEERIRGLVGHDRAEQLLSRRR